MDEYKKTIVGTDNIHPQPDSVRPSGLQIPNEIDRSIIKEMMDGLPFSLTDAQKKVIKQTIEDIHKNDPMLRLVQGDVGSGKTIVAAICAYYIIRKMR